MDILPLEKFIAELEFSYLLILPSKKKRLPQTLILFFPEIKSDYFFFCCYRAQNRRIETKGMLEPLFSGDNVPTIVKSILVRTSTASIPGQPVTS